MDELKLVFPDLPYAVEEAMNRLRINVKFLFIEQYNTQGATITAAPFIYLSRKALFYAVYDVSPMAI